jgi:hypothetical protein
LAKFEKRMTNMIANVKLKKVNCPFQSKISSDIRNMRTSDKTTNYYKMDSHFYNKLLQKMLVILFSNLGNSSIGGGVRFELNPKVSL